MSQQRSLSVQGHQEQLVQKQISWSTCRLVAGNALLQNADHNTCTEWQQSTPGVSTIRHKVTMFPCCLLVQRAQQQIQQLQQLAPQLQQLAASIKQPIRSIQPPSDPSNVWVDTVQQQAGRYSAALQQHVEAALCSAQTPRLLDPRQNQRSAETFDKPSTLHDMTGSLPAVPITAYAMFLQLTYIQQKQPHCQLWQLACMPTSNMLQDVTT